MASFDALASQAAAFGGLRYPTESARMDRSRAGVCGVRSFNQGLRVWPSDTRKAKNERTSLLPANTRTGKRSSEKGKRRSLHSRMGEARLLAFLSSSSVRHCISHATEKMPWKSRQTGGRKLSATWDRKEVNTCVFFSSEALISPRHEPRKQASLLNLEINPVARPPCSPPATACLDVMVCYKEAR